MKDSIAKGVSNLTLILYASGSGTIGINSAIFGGWVLFYYNQVLGLSAVLASSALGISLIFDAVSDPLVGAGQIDSSRDGAEDILSFISASFLWH